MISKKGNTACYIRILTFAGTIIFMIIVCLYWQGFFEKDKSNLFLSTNHGLFNYHIYDVGYNGSIERDGAGIKVSMASHDEKGWFVLTYNDGRSCDILSGPEGAGFQLSFEAKANVDNVIIDAMHMRVDAKDMQIHFSYAKLLEANKWNKCICTGRLYGIPSNAQVLYLSLGDNPAGTEISFRNLRLERID